MVTLGSALKEWQEKNMEGLRYEYDLKPTDIVMDMGAYRGEWCNEIYRLFECNIIVFEPTEAIDFIKIPGSRVKACAWIYKGTIRTDGAFYYTSIEKDGQIAYPCVDIAEYINEEIRLCKINIEGAEYQVIKRLYDEKKLHLIQELQIQFHIGDHTDIMYDMVHAYLSETHELTWRVPFVWENWRRKI